MPAKKEAKTLPCPFCGKTPEAWAGRAVCRNGECGICGIGVPVEHWNRRDEPKPKTKARPK